MLCLSDDGGHLEVAIWRAWGQLPAPFPIAPPLSKFLPLNEVRGSVCACGSPSLLTKHEGQHLWVRAHLAGVVRLNILKVTGENSPWNASSPGRRPGRAEGGGGVHEGGKRPGPTQPPAIPGAVVWPCLHFTSPFAAVGPCRTMLVVGDKGPLPPCFRPVAQQTAGCSSLLCPPGTKR